MFTVTLFPIYQCFKWHGIPNDNDNIKGEYLVQCFVCLLQQVFTKDQSQWNAIEPEIQLCCVLNKMKEKQNRK